MLLPLGSPAETSPSPQSCLANIKNAYFISQTDAAGSPVTPRGNLETGVGLELQGADERAVLGVQRRQRRRPCCGPSAFRWDVLPAGAPVA